MAERPLIVEAHSGTWDHAPGPRQMQQVDIAMRHYWGVNEWLAARDAAQREAK